MPEGNATETLGWRTELPESLRGHEAFASYKTKDDLWNGHIAAVTRSKELEGKLADSIPKLPEDATQEERDVYFLSLGRPEKAEEYAFDAEDKNAPEWNAHWKNEMFNLGLSKSQAAALSKSFNTQMQQMVDAHNANIKKMNSEAETALKTEWGEKFDANLELAQRLWRGDLKDDDAKKADAEFTNLSGAQRTLFAKALFRLASKTGEDTSQRGGGQRQSAAAANPYPKSNMPPARA